MKRKSMKHILHSRSGITVSTHAQSCLTLMRTSCGSEKEPWVATGLAFQPCRHPPAVLATLVPACAAYPFALVPRANAEKDLGGGDKSVTGGLMPPLGGLQ